MSPKVALLIGALWLLTLPGPAATQPPAAAEVSLPDQIGQLNATMREILQLLKQQVEGQETSLLIKRVELTSQTVHAKRELLRKNRAELNRLEEEETSMVTMLEAIEQQASEDSENEAFQRLHWTQMEQRLKSVKKRRQDLEGELAVLENEVRIADEDLEILESILDERLGLR